LKIRYFVSQCKNCVSINMTMITYNVQSILWNIIYIKKCLNEIVVYLLSLRDCSVQKTNYRSYLLSISPLFKKQNYHPQRNVLFIYIYIHPTNNCWALTVKCITALNYSNKKNRHKIWPLRSLYSRGQGTPPKNK